MLGPMIAELRGSVWCQCCFGVSRSRAVAWAMWVLKAVKPAPAEM